MLRSTRPIVVSLMVAALLLVAAHALDRLTFERLYNPRVYDQDWGRMLRTMGYLPFWILAALALALQDGLRFRWRSGMGEASPLMAGQPAPAAGPSGVAPAVARNTFRRAAFSRAGFLFLSTMAGGLAGEILKLIIRRERPWAAAGAYVFRPFTDRPFTGSGLAMPSTHSAVAFAAAFALARLFPRAAPVWYLLAAGCAFTRVAARAHFLSDVVLGGILAWFVVDLLWRRIGRPG